MSPEWRMEWDVTTRLRERGHELMLIEVHDDLTPIRQALDEFEPHIAFNLLEAFDDIVVFDQNVVSYLELLRVPYTGCNPRGLTLARDKALARKLLAYHRIPSPDFTVVPVGRKPVLPRRLGYPLIVKSLTYEASAGISQASVVVNDEQLAKRVRFIHDTLATPAIVEQYIDGRELYVGVLGNHRLRAFPVWEMFFENMQGNNWPIATERVKWNSNYQARHGIETGPAEIPEDVAVKVQHLAKRAYRALELSGYARIDFRMDASGRAHVIEANPNPQLAEGEDFARSAASVGVGYPELLERIMALGIQWQPARMATTVV
ncbi:MAG TPA: ATP-grasp domain-containing protein [Longimicrobiales bacterium]|nr:ATP-grasp domain-containing protein [Longimicrobiales bacterium]